MRDAQTAHERDVLKTSGLADTSVGTQDAKDPSYIEQKGAPRNRGALFVFGEDAENHARSKSKARSRTGQFTNEESRERRRER